MIHSAKMEREVNAKGSAGKWLAAASTFILLSMLAFAIFKMLKYSKKHRDFT
jgi:hypothetical protein